MGYSQSMELQKSDTTWQLNDNKKDNHLVIYQWLIFLLIE